jgi:hypothetical protein
VRARRAAGAGGFDTVVDTLRGGSRRSAANAIPMRPPNFEYNTAVNGPVRTPNSQAQKTAGGNP